MRILPFTVALSFLVPACGTPTDSVAPAGPPAVPLDAPYATAATAWTVDRGLDSPFASGSTVAIGEDGSLYVADAQARVIHRFDRMGTPVVAIGGEGRGPGQFEAITSISVSADTLYVWDPVVWRITAFDSEGTLILTRRVVPRSESGWPPNVARSSDGTWLYLDEEIGSVSEPGVEVEAGVIRAIARLVRWSIEQDMWSPVTEFPGTEAAIVIVDDAEFTLASAPFPRGPLWTVDRLGGYWYADNETYRVVRRNLAGDTLAVVAIDLAGPVTSQSDHDEFVSAGGRIDPASPESRRRAAMEMPDRRPVLLDLLTSRSGDLWVRVDTGEPGSEWHAFGPDHRMRYRLKLPPLSDLRFVAGDTLIVVTRDALDVQSVSRMVVQR